MIENNAINYEKKYKMVCEAIKNYKKEYLEGKDMSTAESLIGNSTCNKIIIYINMIDEKYPTE